MFDWFMPKKKVEAPVEETVETVVEVKEDRDEEFHKRHPGALDGVIYE